MGRETLTLEKMYDMQKVLDTRIIKEKGLEGKDLLPNTVLALQVEIAELANEWRGFKHWSDHKEPKRGYEALIDCDGCNGKGFWFDGPRVKCSKCNETGKVLNPLLEEYVDCLHFFLSIARQLDLPADDLYVADDQLEYDSAIVFTELLHNVGLIMGDQFLLNPPKDVQRYRRDHLRGALYIFYGLGEQRLGFSFEQIAEAYATKNQVNHDRQANGY
ncbi:dUTP diphosphatase [Paenibacillus sp. FSL H7-0735]|uniref:dUTP diphosphatase n=1 Tax=Paenibacillus sp. FSL H7-0735 TaxID=2954736 RepID=UPI0030FB5D49